MATLNERITETERLVSEAFGCEAQSFDQETRRSLRTELPLFYPEGLLELAPVVMLDIAAEMKSPAPFLDDAEEVVRFLALNPPSELREHTRQFAHLCTPAQRTAIVAWLGLLLESPHFPIDHDDIAEVHRDWGALT